MKTFNINSLVTLFVAIAILSLPMNSFAQKVKTETFNVSGECGMCKKKIEKAAKEAGATNAVWNQQTKILKVSYNTLGTSTSAIQQKIANTGYDTPLFKATEEAYNSLETCCQYERSVKKESCCSGSNCEMKDGKCTDPAVCKDKACCGGTDACKDMSMGCCKKASK
ncbi:MAG: cation transporter [Bacteroidota bacterium]